MWDLVKQVTGSERLFSENLLCVHELWMGGSLAMPFSPSYL